MLVTKWLGFAHRWSNKGKRLMMRSIYFPLSMSRLSHRNKRIRNLGLDIGQGKWASLPNKSLILFHLYFLGSGEWCGCWASVRNQKIKEKERRYAPRLSLCVPDGWPLISSFLLYLCDGPSIIRHTHLFLFIFVDSWPGLRDLFAWSGPQIKRKRIHFVSPQSWTMHMHAATRWPTVSPG